MGIISHLEENCLIQKCFLAKRASPSWFLISDQSGHWLVQFTIRLGLEKDIELSLSPSIWYPDVGYKLKLSGFGLVSAGWCWAFIGSGFYKSPESFPWTGALQSLGAGYLTFHSGISTGS